MAPPTSTSTTRYPLNKSIRSPHADAYAKTSARSTTTIIRRLKHDDNENENDEDDVYLNVITQRLFRDVANILDGELQIKSKVPEKLINALPNKITSFLDEKLQIKTKDGSDFADVLPMLASCIGSSSRFKAITDRCRSNSSSATTFISRLLGRFECVARSKDLNRMMGLPSWSVQKVLEDTVRILEEEEWTKFISVDIKEEEIKLVEALAKSHIKSTYGTMIAVQIKHSRWLDALRYVCWYQEKATSGYPEIHTIKQALFPFQLCEIMETNSVFLDDDGLYGEFFAPNTRVMSGYKNALMLHQAEEDQQISKSITDSINNNRACNGMAK